MANFGSVYLFRGSNSIGFSAPAVLSSSYALFLPSVAPTNGQELAFDGTTLIWRTPPASGNVDSVSSLTSAITVAISNRDAQIDFASGASNLFLATPDGAAGKPALRAIASNDVPNISASKITTGTIAVSRMPSGTNAQTWQIDVDATGIKIESTSATLATLYQNDGVTLADIRVRKITADVTESASATVINTHDTKVSLNSDFTTGTPTEDLGLVGIRGDQASSQFLWVESLKQWTIGVVGAMLPVCRKREFSFTNGDLVAGKYTLVHNLNTKSFTYTIWMGDDRSFFAEVRAIDLNSAEIDLTAVGTISGTWRITLSI